MLPHATLRTDIAILGGGPAGYVAAIRAAQRKASVILIEGGELGGVCLNRGCIPTKAMLKSAEAIHLVQNALPFGVDAGSGRLQWETVLNRKGRVVRSLRTGLSSLLPAKGVTVLHGYGTVRSSGVVEVLHDDRITEVHCDRLILATGSEASIPAIAGIDHADVITSTEALDLAEIPERLVILGAGVIGMEFATMFSAFGSRVTVIEQEMQLLPGMDDEVAAGLLKTLKRKKVRFQLGQTVQQIKETQEGLIVSLREGEPLVCDKLLVATGRRSRTDAFAALNLSTENGFVTVDQNMETSVPGVYAAGDLIGGPLLAHLAFAEGRVAADRALGIAGKVAYHAVPACVYTSPEVAVVGLTEKEAAAKGMHITVGRFDFRANGRAQTLGEREGFVKVIADQAGIIQGGLIFGPGASEMISELTLAVACGAHLQTLADLIHPHPTLSEAVWEACNSALGMGIHGN